MITPEEIKEIINEMLQKGVTLQWWSYFIFAIIAFVASYLGRYLRKKGDYRAIREEFDKILDQNKKITNAIEQIRNNFYVSKALHDKFIEKIVDFYTILHKYYRSCQKVVDSSHIMNKNGRIVSTEDLWEDNLDEIKKRYDETEGYISILLPESIHKIIDDLIKGLNRFRDILKTGHDEPLKKYKNLTDCFNNEIHENKKKLAIALRVYFKIENEN